MHRYAILSLVELKFCVKNPWISMGNCIGNLAGAVCGLPAARMLFLLDRSLWYCLGTFRVNSQPLRMKFLCVEFEVLDCSLSPEWMSWNRSGESAGCLKELGGIPIGLDEFCLCIFLSFPFEELACFYM